MAGIPRVSSVRAYLWCSVLELQRWSSEEMLAVERGRMERERRGGRQRVDWGELLDEAWGYEEDERSLRVTVNLETQLLTSRRTSASSSADGSEEDNVRRGISQSLLLESPLPWTCPGKRTGLGDSPRTRSVFSPLRSVYSPSNSVFSPSLISQTSTPKGGVECRQPDGTPSELGVSLIDTPLCNDERKDDDENSALEEIRVSHDEQIDRGHENERRCFEGSGKKQRRNEGSLDVERSPECVGDKRGYTLKNCAVVITKCSIPDDCHIPIPTRSEQRLFSNCLSPSSNTQLPIRTLVHSESENDDENPLCVASDTRAVSNTRVVSDTHVVSNICVASNTHLASNTRVASNTHVTCNTRAASTTSSTLNHDCSTATAQDWASSYHTLTPPALFTPPLFSSQTPSCPVRDDVVASTNSASSSCKLDVASSLQSIPLFSSPYATSLTQSEFAKPLSNRSTPLTTPTFHSDRSTSIHSLEGRCTAANCNPISSTSVGSSLTTPHFSSNLSTPFTSLTTPTLSSNQSTSMTSSKTLPTYTSDGRMRLRKLSQSGCSEIDSASHNSTPAMSPGITTDGNRVRKLILTPRTRTCTQEKRSVQKENRYISSLTYNVLYTVVEESVTYQCMYGTC